MTGETTPITSTSCLATTNIISSTDLLHSQIVEIVYDAITNVWWKVIIMNNTDDNTTNNDDKIDNDGQWNTIKLFEMIQSSISVWDHNNNEQGGKEFYDVEIRTATSLFHRYKQKQQQINNRDDVFPTETNSTDNDHLIDDNNNNNCNTKKKRRKSKQSEKVVSTSYILIIQSSYGVERTIHSSYELAQLLIPYIENHNIMNNISNHIRIAMSSGFICICTKHKILSINTNQQQQQHHNNSVIMLESCPYCPNWYKGTKGLWWHIQQYHKMNYSIATSFDSIHKNQLAIIIYENNNNTNITSNNVSEENFVTKLHHETSSQMKDTDDDKIVQDQQPTAIMMNDKSTTSIDTACQKKMTNNNVIMMKTTIGVLKNQLFDNVMLGNLIQLKNTITQLEQQWKNDDDNNNNKCYILDQYIDKNGCTILLWAAGYGYTDIVQYLLENHYCYINFQQYGKRSYYGRTALHWSCRNGQYNTVQYLLSSFTSFKGEQEEKISNNNNNMKILDIEAMTSDGTTAFCWAAWQGHLSILQLLYQYKCNVQTINSYGCNAVLWAAQGCSGSIQQQQQNKIENENSNEHRKNTDNSITENGTIIETASSKSKNDVDMTNFDDLEDCKSLINNHQQQQSELTTDTSSSFNNIPIEIQVINWLESVGCPIFIVNHSGHGVLHKAAQRGHLSLCSWYMNHHVIPNWQSYLNNIRMISSNNSTIMKQEQQDVPLHKINDNSDTNHQRDSNGSNENILNCVDVMKWIGKQLQLIGPDHDGYTPSDLAGMERYEELAIALVQYEEKLIRMTFQIISTIVEQYTSMCNDTHHHHYLDTNMLPEWLQSQTLPARNEIEHMLFEQWAGVNRMRSIWTILTKEQNQKN